MKTALPETTIGAAHALADAGFAVIPIHTVGAGGVCTCGRADCGSPGKHPRCPRGLHDATRDHDLIDTWWEPSPETPIALAIATGDPSRRFVVDVDGEEGAASLRELTAQHGRLPETVTSKTGRGGHLAWGMPEGRDVRNSASKIGPNIDVRGNGGYVIVPPSPHPAGRRYEWTRDPFNHDVAAAPDWLLELVARPEPVPDLPPPPPAEGPHRDRYVEAAIRAECAVVARTPPGGRNDQLNRSAWALARFVATGDAPASVIVWRLARAARMAGLAPREVEKTLASAFGARGAA